MSFYGHCPQSNSCCSVPKRVSSIVSILDHSNSSELELVVIEELALSCKGNSIECFRTPPPCVCYFSCTHDNVPNENHLRVYSGHSLRVQRPLCWVSHGNQKYKAACDSSSLGRGEQCSSYNLFCVSFLFPLISAPCVMATNSPGGLFLLR